MGTGWRQHLEEHQTTADEAVRCVRSGQRVLVGSGCAAPQALLEALVRRSPELADVELVHLLTMGLARYVDERHEGHFRHNAFFIGPNVRGAVGEGRADYTPVFLSEIPDLFYSHRMRLDVAMVMVTPPDRNGYVSLGIHPDVAMAGIETARIVVAQINPNMPRIHGDTFVHVSKLDYIVEHAAPLAELPPRHRTTPPSPSRATSLGSYRADPRCSSASGRSPTRSFRFSPNTRISASTAR